MTSSSKSKKSTSSVPLIFIVTCTRSSSAEQNGIFSRRFSWSPSLWRLNDLDRADSRPGFPQDPPARQESSVVSQLPPSKYRWSSDNSDQPLTISLPAGWPPSPPSACLPCSASWQAPQLGSTALRSGRPQSVSPSLPSQTISSSTQFHPNQEKVRIRTAVHLSSLISVSSSFSDFVGKQTIILAT